MTNLPLNGFFVSIKHPFYKMYYVNIVSEILMYYLVGFVGLY